MSFIRNVNPERFAYDGLSRRTVAAIQKQTVKKGKRDIFSRFIRKDDKDAIAGWKQDFPSNLPRTFGWPPLTITFPL